MKTNRQGFSVVELLMIVVVVAIIVLLGWTAYSRFNNPDEAKEQAPQTASYNQASDLPQAPEVKDTTGLDEAASVLDSVELDGNNNELIELDKELNKF